MKNLLNYYYYIVVDRINMKGGNYYFIYQNNYFCFYKYFGNLNEIQDIFNLNTYMLFNNYKVNKIILNNTGNILTSYNNNLYCLVLLTYNSNNLVNLNQVISFNQFKINLNILNRSNWYFLWTNKIDNIEYSIKHLMHKYKLIYNSIYYYIGLAENAISYLKYINLENNNISICHKRVCSKYNITEFYNPLNLIIDYRVRDLAEFFKSAFFNQIMDVSKIINYLKKIKMTSTDYIYFYIRMLFPSFYFDLYDQVLKEEIKEETILMVINMQDEYEYLLYEIYLVIKSHVDIIGIDWINKKFAF